MFRPIRKLGKGNFATVYEAERLSDGLRFAVKAFSKQNILLDLIKQEIIFKTRGNDCLLDTNNNQVLLKYNNI